MFVWNDSLELLAVGFHGVPISSVVMFFQSALQCTQLQCHSSMPVLRAHRQHVETLTVLIHVLRRSGYIEAIHMGIYQDTRTPAGFCFVEYVSVTRTLTPTHHSSPCTLVANYRLPTAPCPILCVASRSHVSSLHLAICVDYMASSHAMSLHTFMFEFET